MKIGYSVEGSSDRAVITGLRNRWCPRAELIEGKFRGQTRTSRRREIPKICRELTAKSVDMIVFLTDSNVNPWRDVQRGDAEKCPEEHRHLCIFGVCDRNVECWLAADSGHLARETGSSESGFRDEDPKSAVEKAFAITGTEKQEEKVADFVSAAPLRQWLSNSSFEDFFDQVRQMSKGIGCQIENLRASTH